jgi:hypothetical protein
MINFDSVNISGETSSNDGNRQLQSADILADFAHFGVAALGI